jgi:serine protease SohB
MAEFFADYGLFVLKTITIVAALVIVIGTIAAAGRKAMHEGLEVEDLNSKYRSLATALKRIVLKKSELKADAKAEKARKKAQSKSDSKVARICYRLQGRSEGERRGIFARGQCDPEIATPEDQVVRLENYGGGSRHGLAASQLARIRAKGIPLIVAVDKGCGKRRLSRPASVAVFAAPFAILGSIGVIAQIPNFNRMLDTHGVDFEQVTAGRTSAMSPCLARTPMRIARA